MTSLRQILSSKDTDAVVRALGSTDLTIIARALLKSLAVEAIGEECEAEAAVEMARKRASRLSSGFQRMAHEWIEEAREIAIDRKKTRAFEEFLAAAPRPVEAPTYTTNMPTVEMVWEWVKQAAKDLHWELSDEQATGAVELLCKLYVPGRAGTTDIEASLAGFAGTGKTVLLRLLAYIARYMLKRPVIVLAPTGKAAARLREVFRAHASLSDIPITTIHSTLYGQPVTMGRCPSCGAWSAAIMDAGEDMSGHDCPKCHVSLPFGTTFETMLAFMKPRTIGEPDTLVLVDEGSMVPAKDIGNDLRAEVNKVLGMRIIVAGDAGQLDPVAAGRDAGVMVDLTRATVTLTQIHRQRANTPVSRLTLRLRRPMTVGCLLWNDPELSGVFGERGDESVRLHTGRNGSHHAAAKWLIGHYQSGESATLLAYSNKCRHAANTAVREVAGFPKPGVLCTDGTIALPLLREERVLVLANNAQMDMMNGEVFVVSESKWLQTPAMLNRVCGDYCIMEITVVGGLAPFYAFADLFDDGLAADTRGNTYRTRLGALRRGVEAAYKMWLEQTRRLVNAGKAPPDVVQVLKDGDDMALQALFRESYGDMLPERFLWVTWGYCLTIHKSQGSQWRRVGLFWDWAMGKSSFERPNGHKLPYTAVSRAERSVDFFVPPST